MLGIWRFEWACKYEADTAALRSFADVFGSVCSTLPAGLHCWCLLSDAWNLTTVTPGMSGWKSMQTAPKHDIKRLSFMYVFRAMPWDIWTYMVYTGHTCMV